MFVYIDDEKKKALVDEALKGERGVGDISAEAGVSRWTLSKLLEEHYAANPDDPRRHLIVRESERYQRGPDAQALADEPDTPDTPDGAESPGADAEAREEMAKPKKRKTERYPTEKKEKVFAA